MMEFKIGSSDGRVNLRVALALALSLIIVTSEADAGVTVYDLGAGLGHGGTRLPLNSFREDVCTPVSLLIADIVESIELGSYSRVERIERTNAVDLL